jgi:hypothetical protein
MKKYYSFLSLGILLLLSGCSAIEQGVHAAVSIFFVMLKFGLIVLGIIFVIQIIVYLFSGKK